MYGMVELIFFMVDCASPIHIQLKIGERRWMMSTGKLKLGTGNTSIATSEKGIVKFV